MEKQIKKYLKNNDYNGKGLVDFFGKGAQWCACTTNGTSGIISYKGYKYYFACIKPWAYCPKGDIVVETIRA